MTMNEKDVNRIERFRRLVVRLLFQLGWLMVLTTGVTFIYSIYNGEDIDVLTERIYDVVYFIWSVDYEMYIFMLIGCYVFQGYGYIRDYIDKIDYVGE